MKCIIVNKLVCWIFTIKKIVENSREIGSTEENLKYADNNEYYVILCM